MLSTCTAARSKARGERDSRGARARARGRTHAKVVRGAADVVCGGVGVVGVSEGLARDLLVPAPAGVVKVGVQLCEDGRVLERAVAGGVGGEGDVRLVLQERVVPAAGSAGRVQRRGGCAEGWGRTHLLIMRALTRTFSPCSLRASMRAFCLSK